MTSAHRQLRALLALISPALLGCAAGRYFPEESEMARFEAAGPVIPEVDQDALLGAMPSPGPYRVVTGDLLQIHAPALFAIETEASRGGGAQTEYLVRVDDDGRIQVPLAGEVEAVHLTLPEIEHAISEAVFPKYLTRRPAVVVKIEEYRRTAVSVMGAVDEPGLHYLRSDQMSLYGALAEAGGIMKSSNLVVGARRIRVLRGDGSDAEAPIVLPVKGLNLPMSDVALVGGERIEVERYEPDTFTVVGLVAKPGAYEYPPEVTYNLMQALATAGGVDRIADPPYATVFRKDADGTIIPATFEIKGDGLVESSSLRIKPGDVIAVQHTAVSWTRSFLAEVFRIQVNFFSGTHAL